MLQHYAKLWGWTKLETKLDYPRYHRVQNPAGKRFWVSGKYKQVIWLPLYPNGMHNRHRKNETIISFRALRKETNYMSNAFKRTVSRTEKGWGDTEFQAEV